MNLARSLADSSPTWNPVFLARLRKRSPAAGRRYPGEIEPRIASGLQKNAPRLLRKTPVRPDRARDIRKRAIYQLRDQQARVVHRPRHFYPAFRDRLYPDAAVIGLVADQQHE